MNMTISIIFGAFLLIYAILIGCMILSSVWLPATIIDLYCFEQEKYMKYKEVREYIRSGYNIPVAPRVYWTCHRLLNTDKYKKLRYRFELTENGIELFEHDHLILSVLESPLSEKLIEMQTLSAEDLIDGYTLELDAQEQGYASFINSVYTSYSNAARMSPEEFVELYKYWPVDEIPC